MQELRNDNDVLMWKDFSKEDVGEDKFIEEVKRFFEEVEEMKEFKGKQPRCRVLIQIDDPKERSNSTAVNFDLRIEDFQIKEYCGNQILVINENNLNQGTRLDLDITNANIAEIVFDREDGYKSLQIDGKGIWIYF
jgi:hypothetical protein